MTLDANFESISYNLFTENYHVFNSESDQDINFHSDIASLNTKCFNPN